MKRHALNLLIWLGAAAFAFGIFQLFKLRFAAGDVYPAYSSLRADPLGTMALFESLERISGHSVKRDFSSANQLPPGPGSTYLHLAATPDEWLGVPEELVREIQRYVLEGGRLVIAFLPETSRPSSGFRPAVAPGKPPPGAPKSGIKDPFASPLFKDRWGVEFGFEPLQAPSGDNYDPVRVTRQTGGALPAELDWHGGMIFTNVNPAWTTVYGRGTNPVVLERKFGAGTVVLLTDCFCFSNEAMLSDRHPELLAWLIGPASTIQFDEAHLGLTENPGVSGLMRQYRLHGLVAGLLLVVGLFIWQHSVSFLPRADGNKVGAEVTGKKAAAGLVNLLSRNIPPKDVLRVCFEEWSKSLARRDAHPLARIDQAQAIFEAEAQRAKADQNPVRAYREIRQALKAPKRKM